MASTASNGSSWTLALSSDDDHAAHFPWTSSFPTSMNSEMMSTACNSNHSNGICQGVSGSSVPVLRRGPRLAKMSHSLRSSRSSRLTGSELRPSRPVRRSTNSSSSSRNSSSSTASSQPINTVYKTQQCKNWAATGTCDYDWRCQFAHGEKDVREPTRHDLYKTKPCRNFIKGVEGSCPFRDRCDYIHDETDEKNEKQACQEPAETGQMLVTLLKTLSLGNSASSLDYFVSRSDEGVDTRVESRTESPILPDTQGHEQFWTVLEELEEALLGSRSSEYAASFNNFVYDLWNEEEDNWHIPCHHGTQEFGVGGMEKDFEDASSESGYSSLNSTPRRQSLSQYVGKMNLDVFGDFCGIEEEIEAYWCEFYNPNTIMDDPCNADSCIEDILAE